MSPEEARELLTGMQLFDDAGFVDPVRGYMQIPCDFGGAMADMWTRTVRALREFVSNAVSYKATMAHTMFARMADRIYLVFGHNGEPLRTGDEAILKGVTPNITDNRGYALQGCGLCATAASMQITGHEELLFCSHCQNGEWVVARGGRDMTAVNRWSRKPVTQEWLPEFVKIFGKELIDQFTVIYAVHAMLPRKGSPGFSADDIYIPGRLLTTLSAMAPDMITGVVLPDDVKSVVDFDVARDIERVTRKEDKLSLRCSEKMLGSQYGGKIDYRSLYLARTTGEGNTGSVGRGFVSWAGYLARYACADGHLNLPVPPVDVELAEGLTVRVSKSKIVFNVLPNHYNGQWVMNERDGNVDGKFHAGGGNELGRRPTMACYFLAPWVYDETVRSIGEEAARPYGRFRDNAMGMYDKPKVLTDLMLLNYINDESRPWLIMHFVVEEVAGRVLDDGTLEPLTPEQFVTTMGRRSDFVFTNTTGMYSIMKAMCKVGRDGIPKEFRELCESLWPYDIHDFAPLDGEVGKGRRKVKTESREPTVVLIDLKNKRLFDRKYHCGDQCLFVPWHRLERRVLTTDEIKTHKSTRGVVLEDMTTKAAFWGVQGFIQQLEREGIEAFVDRVYEPVGNGHANGNGHVETKENVSHE